MATKRSATQLETISDEGQAFNKAPILDNGKAAPRRSKGQQPSDLNPEMGEFEDEWEDELDDGEGVVVDAKEHLDGEDDSMDVDVHPAIEDEEPNIHTIGDVYLPGSHTLAKDEVLEADQSVYEMLHHMNVTWPCLSFDFLRDSLGDERRRYPATTYAVSGTQADVAKNNEVLVMKMSQLHRTQRDDNDSDSDDDSDSDSVVDDDAILEYRSIPHMGGINRVRAQPLPSLPASASQPYFTAVFSETSKVNIYDVRPLIESLSTPGYTFDKSRTNKPAYTVNSHRTEGFALDWSNSSSSGGGPRLLSGDGDGKIYLTNLASNGHWTTQPQPFTSHTSSVEDIQWSPTETTVFASCSADKSIRIWDVRVKGKKNAAGMLRAHESDVNVISWNRGTSYLLISGGDEGHIKVWDLRNVKGTTNSPSPVAAFTWHKAPVTSIEWHPSEDSIFAASGADDQLTLWDLSVEMDEDEAGSKEILTASGEKIRDVPQQLLFVHQGQKDVKEVHWHPQIPGLVGSTAGDGFNIFKTISV